MMLFNYFILKNMSNIIYKQMVYHEVKLGPTEGQLSDLASGIEVKLSPEHLVGDIPFQLTTAQLKKLQKAASAGKGCTLKFKAAQIKHMGQKGSGRFSDLLKRGFEMAKPLLQSGLHKGIEYGGQMLENKLSDMAGLQQGSGFFGDIVRSVGNVGVGALANLAGGSVKPKVSKKHKAACGQCSQCGAGFFGDLVRGVGNVGVGALANLAGGSVNPYSNPNEQLQAALYQKKVYTGQGLKM